MWIHFLHAIHIHLSWKSLVFFFQINWYSAEICAARAILEKMQECWLYRSKNIKEETKKKQTRAYISRKTTHKKLINMKFHSNFEYHSTKKDTWSCFYSALVCKRVRSVNISFVCFLWKQRLCSNWNNESRYMYVKALRCVSFTPSITSIIQYQIRLAKW